MSTSEDEGTLTPDELLAFGGLARCLVRADGQFTEEEQTALEGASAELFRRTTPRGGAYRTQRVEQEGDRGAIFEVLQRAALALPDEDAVRRAAAGVTRPAARHLIYAVLRDVAASDVIATSEWPLLEWLSQTWGIDSTTA
jgi:hypothetical protein